MRDLSSVIWFKLARGPIQLGVREILFVLAAVRARPRCKLLVFGAGNDSALWQLLNRGGRTAFIEDDLDWIAKLASKHPSLEVHATRYTTRISDWKALVQTPERLELALPAAIVDERWDVILIDGPRGNFMPSQMNPPGRMSSIFMARRLIAPGGDIFVHDCEREVEAACCARFFADAVVRGEVTGRALLRQYRI